MCNNSCDHFTASNGSNKYNSSHSWGAYPGIMSSDPRGVPQSNTVPRVKDVQGHGLQIKPVDIPRSRWSCMLEKEDNGTLSLPLGFRYVRGMREASAIAFEDLARVSSPSPGLI
jgi:hypothetical protein